MADVLAMPDSSNLSTARAADWAVQVNTGTPTTPEWEWVNGISKFDPSNDPTMQDDTDINSGGWKSQLVTAQSLDVAMEGLLKGLRDETGVVASDPGLNFIREKGQQVGEDNIVELRAWRTDDVPTAWRHRFAAGFKDVGGGNEELQKWTCDLRGRGAPTVITKPLDADNDGVEDTTP